MSLRPYLFVAALSLTVACSSKKPDRAEPERAELRIDGPFPIVEGTRFTFRGHAGEKVFEPWETTLTVTDRATGRLQYVPHNDVASVFTKQGFRVDARGISISGDDLDGPLDPVLAIAFPIASGDGHEVPGMFPATYTAVAQEKVEVPAGTFDTWRISIEDKVNKPAAVWIAPGTGVVRFQHPSGRIDELVSIAAP